MKGLREMQTGWKRSSFCSSGVCVEIQQIGQNVRIRDSKQNTLGLGQPIIDLDIQEWQNFVCQLSSHRCTKAGHVLDIAYGKSSVNVASRGVKLAFGVDEWKAFIDGVNAGEFD